MAETSGRASARSNTTSREGSRDVGPHSRHKIFLSHSGAQKDFVEQLCVDLKRWDQQPFFDKCRYSLPIGEDFPEHIFEAIRQCQVGVVVLSEEFFTRSKWPMIELVEMVRKAKKRQVGFKIVPVFLGISMDQFCDPTRRGRWLSCWHKLALNDKRIDEQEWKGALKHLEPLNSMVYDGWGEVKFRREIVDVLCEAVPLETRLEDSNVQGRSRLCKVIQGQISKLEVEKNEGVVLVGLYGVGGIGKTSISKVLCNEYVTRFRGRVCHAEMGKKSREELLREVLKRLTDTSCVLLDRWNEDELLRKLNEGIIEEPAFLVVDNVSAVQASIEEAKRYVLARLPRGSIVMVTSRSKETLQLVRADLVNNNVMEMPELDLEEARSLFCKSCDMESKCEVDGGIVKRCVDRCYFKKGDGQGSSHYHPLALYVLGKQLAPIDVEMWEAHLDRIDKNVFNQSGEVKHEVFEMLSKSYNLLTQNDQLFYVDVVLFLLLPSKFGGSWRKKLEHKLNTYEWLGMVHSISVDDVVSKLKELKRKSLLENLGDGIEMSIGIHDLWRAFCETIVQSGELSSRRWMYGARDNTKLIKRCHAGVFWEDVTRMAFLDFDSKSDLERVNFSHFPNVTILNVAKASFKGDLVLDLAGLQCLKSLDISSGFGEVILLNLPRCLVFLRILSHSFNVCWDIDVTDVRYLTKLEHLELWHYGGDKLPDLKGMVSLRVAIFINCENVVTVRGLSMNLSNLQVLLISSCKKLRSCPGVGDLVMLQSLSLKGCQNLKKLPNLGKLRNLRKLVLDGSEFISEVEGLGDLVALEELQLGDYIYNSKYLYLALSLYVRSLKNLRILRLPGFQMEALQGLDSLVRLQDVEVDFQELVVKPSVRQLMKLQTLRMSHGWDLERLNELNILVMLHDLTIEGCFGVDNLPNIEGLISLMTLKIHGCGFKSIGGLSNVTTLKRLKIHGCGLLERLPNLQGLIRLKQLKITQCNGLRKWDFKVEAMEGSSSCPLVADHVGHEVPNSQMLMALEELELKYCGLHVVFELPNLNHFPQMKRLDVRGCERFWKLEICEPTHALTTICIVNCSNLKQFPDLSVFPSLVSLKLIGCNEVVSLSAKDTLHSFQELIVHNYSRYDGNLEKLPDMGMFPAIETLSLVGLTKLTLLKSSVRVPTLKSLEVRGCTSLSRVDLDELQVLCPQCTIQHDCVIERTMSRWSFKCLRS